MQDLAGLVDLASITIHRLDHEHRVIMMSRRLLLDLQVAGAKPGLVQLCLIVGEVGGIL